MSQLMTGSRKCPAKSNGQDSDEDFANLSELDVSDNEFDLTRKKVAGRQCNVGGPVVPKKGSVSDDVYNNALNARKKYTDKRRYNNAKEKGSSVTDVAHDFTGVCDDQLRPMSVVKDRRFQKDHTFPTKDILWIRIAEEANLRSMHVTTYRSNAFNLIVFADQFFVGSTFIPGIGWKVNIAAVRDGDDGLNLAMYWQVGDLAAIYLSIDWAEFCDFCSSLFVHV